MKRTLLAACAALAMAALASAADSAQTVLVPGAGERPGAVFEFQPAGENGAQASDINQWGLVTGMTYIADGWHRAFRAWPKRPLQVLGTPGGPYSHGLGINDFGDVVGESSTTERTVAFRQVGATLRSLGPLVAVDINNLGVAAGWTETQAALWTVAGAVRLLYTPSRPPGDESGTWWGGASGGINDRGQAAGFYTDADGAHAVRWEPDGSVTELGPGTALAINEAGDVAGWGYDSPSFLWRDTTGRVDIHDIAPLGMNDTGQLVGICGNGTPDYDACVWSEAGGVIRLQKPTGGTGRAEGINDLGEVVGTVSSEDYPVHALWWYAPPSERDQLATAATLLRILRDDRVINHGRHTALHRALTKAERAFSAGDRNTAARFLEQMGQQLGSWGRGGVNRRLVRLEALVKRLAMRIRSS